MPTEVDVELIIFHETGTQNFFSMQLFENSFGNGTFKLADINEASENLHNLVSIKQMEDFLRYFKSTNTRSSNAKKY